MVLDVFMCAYMHDSIQTNKMPGADTVRATRIIMGVPTIRTHTYIFIIHLSVFMSKVAKCIGENDVDLFTLKALFMYIYSNRNSITKLYFSTHCYGKIVTIRGCIRGCLIYGTNT